jgi:hypothetical protein
LLTPTCPENKNGMWHKMPLGPRISLLATTCFNDTCLSSMQCTHLECMLGQCVVALLPAEDLTLGVIVTVTWE